jgi:predicted nuclease of predicted toxin-antitoxin system
MNLSPSWIAILEGNGISAVHWSAIGKGSESDSVVLGWAREHDYLVFTHDLDFGAILASTKASGPSVISVRTQDVSPDHLGKKPREGLTRVSRDFSAGRSHYH